MNTKKIEWKKIRWAGNEVLSGKGFFISYQPFSKPTPEQELMNGVGAILFGAPKNTPETALLIPAEESCLILEGDWRKEYAKAFPGGLQSVLAVYQKNIKHRTKWSTDVKITIKDVMEQFHA